MSKADLYKRLDKASEITLSVKGRKSGRDIPRPVWFVHEGNTLYLLPVQGSDTNWYKNLLTDPTLKISVNGGGRGEEEARGGVAWEQRIPPRSPNQRRRPPTP